MNRSSIRLSVLIPLVAALAACSGGGGSTPSSSGSSPASTGPATGTGSAPASGTAEPSARPSPKISGRLFGPEAHCMGPANCFLSNPKKLSESELATMLKGLSGATAAPPGEAPWPFVVLDAPEAGLPVRSRPAPDAPVVAEEGTALRHRLVYAYCRSTTGPDGWFRIQSLQDAAEGEYYVEGRYLHAFHHDGQIPTCR
ncbi:hypothetical protein [Arsenicicoccus dermatophilus]|uniref:hypothetical protein n=1 Tax=Arsenicicoccus dermatophilus TaxID=1076331 RepID=UPI001F4C7990|nr:hypothetical protein [Arsenicicoccus dermatophilus]MCH8613551.1 hypothetical protein [Arsenicicoccus dermatophilus]